MAQFDFEWDFYKGRKVLVTGHTGFKGTWMCMLLVQAGAHVTGYALKPPTDPSVFALSGVEQRIHSVFGDIRDLSYLQKVFDEVQPEVVIHMAAQPIVRESYRNPVYTYEVNVMGTVNILECVRTHPCVQSFVNVTTDKVYLNKEWEWGYRENEELNGYDPYSNSKSCSELATSSYRNSFFRQNGKDNVSGIQQTAISTARAGNVIGGGDFAADRIVPDCIRAVLEGRPIIVRNPYSTRPYQHVLEPVAVYLMLAARQWENPCYAGCYNVGPDDTDCYTTGELVALFCEKWNRATGQQAIWQNEYDGGPHEANFLKLDCSKLKGTFGWRPVWNLEQAMDKIVEWTAAYRNGADIEKLMNGQIEEFIGRGYNVSSKR